MAQISLVILFQMAALLFTVSLAQPAGVYLKVRDTAAPPIDMVPEDRAVSWIVFVIFMIVFVIFMAFLGGLFLALVRVLFHRREECMGRLRRIFRREEK
ncbi:hypothetical protein C8A00DRAFT_33673 [Chaetomidium leptoderma]|uniref:Uncharacterized protein n=1 Tax=Chaetomidium leptoderma TaxID=669021 RepID=A0AAN6VLS4_9PEZI|nr:hypothetical protein C8A00DRAFT_33673 [Chaetomidium leptoderma]